MKTPSTPPAIAALLFDMGGVVIDIDFERALQIWTSHSRLPIDQIRGRFSMDEAYAQHEIGEIGAVEYFAHLRERLELSASDAEICAGWNAIFKAEISQSVDYILAVRDKIPCYAFTNSNPTHQVYWAAAYPRVVDSFHRVFVSSELGLRKPHREAFEAISDFSGIALQEMLFFDDLEENVDGARAAGLQAVHVKTHRDVRKALQETGLL